MTDSLTTAEAVAALVAAHPKWLDDGRGVPADPSPDATLIGTGESYAAWLVLSRELADLRARQGPRAVVVRVPLENADLPRPMSEEFAALVAAPEGIGPRPIHLATGQVASHADPAAVGLGEVGGGPAYMVVEHVPGHPRPAAGWTDDLLAAHAGQLARLHERAYDGCGEVTATDQLQPRLSIVDTGEANWQWWHEHYRELTTATDVSALWPRVRTLFAATEPQFERLERFALTHGDAAAPNILVAGGVPRYVDWEWAGIGDPARDLAFIGGAVWLDPWYLRLGPERIERYLRAYVAAGGHGEPQSLAARGRCWLVNEVFFVALHFRRRAEQGAGAEYAERADTLLVRLDAALD